MYFFRQLLLVLTILLLGCIRDSASILSPPNGFRYSLPIQVQVDQNFSPEQQALLKKAFQSWEKASQNKIRFEVNFNRPKPNLFFKYNHLNKYSSNFIWKIPQNSEQFTKEEIHNFIKNRYLAMTYYSDEYNSSHEKPVNVVILNSIEEEKFYQIVLHEIGHLIGLQHIKYNSAVMDMYASSSCITKKDAAQLCYLYACSPQPECF